MPRRRMNHVARPRFSPESVAKLDQFADMMGMDRSSALNRILETSFVPPDPPSDMSKHELIEGRPIRICQTWPEVLGLAQMLLMAMQRGDGMAGSQHALVLSISLTHLLKKLDPATPPAPVPYLPLPSGRKKTLLDSLLAITQALRSGQEAQAKRYERQLRELIILGM